MDKSFKIPPKSPAHLTDNDKLALILKELIGKEFLLTGKTRTDGANLRKGLLMNSLKTVYLKVPMRRILR